MAEFFVRRPIVAIVIAIFTIILGLAAMSRLPVAQFPEITPPMVSISANYLGAEATNVEQSVATPIEQKVNGVEGMLYMRSTNSSDGRMQLDVSFEVGTDLDMANVLTQNRVAEAQSMLPEEVKRQGVTIKKQLPSTLLLLSIVSPGGTYDEQFLTNYATINLVDEIARLQGVGLVEVIGGSISQYAMRIWVKPEQLAKLNLTIADIRKAIQEQNTLMPAGQIGGAPAPEGTEFTYTVRTESRFETPEEFGQVVVRSNDDGSQVLLRDVARIDLGSQGYLVSSRTDGRATALLQVFQLPDANGLEVAQSVIAAMEELSANFPDDMEHVVSLDTTRPVTAGIQEIVTSLFQAMVLVILVVFVFLQSFRATLIPSLAVPVSLIGTLAVFPLLGFSINTLTLLALVLAIGIVVDNGIVVVEAVSSKIEEGLTPRDATVKAMHEVSGPIVATSFALIGVFLPVAAMAGITGQLYKQFAITIVAAVALSTINALTLSPALSALLLKPSGESKKSFLTPFFLRFNAGFDVITRHFMTLTEYLNRRLAAVFATFVVILIATFVLFRVLPGGFVPEEDQAYLLGAFMLPEGASLQRTKEVMEDIDTIISGFEPVQNSTTVAGFSALTGTIASNSGFIFIQLKSWDERSKPEDRAVNVMHRLNAEFASKIHDAEAFAFGPSPIPGLGTGSGFSMMLQDRGSNSPEYLAEQVRLFVKAARQRPELEGVKSVFSASSPQIFLEVDKAKALKLGIPLDDLNSTVGAFLGGAYVNDFNRFGRLYKSTFRLSLNTVREWIRCVSFTSATKRARWSHCRHSPAQVVRWARSSPIVLISSGPQRLVARPRLVTVPARR
jgi:HAE1 family hydrophobic/amphiphilic exporter-1